MGIGKKLGKRRKKEKGEGVIVKCAGCLCCASAELGKEASVGPGRHCVDIDRGRNEFRPPRNHDDEDRRWNRPGRQDTQS